MEIKVINWNIGGAKFLQQKKRANREGVRRDLNAALKGLVKKNEPDIITLQEIVQYQEPGTGQLVDLVDEIEGYRYYPFPLIDSRLFSSQAKWRNLRDGSDWDENTYFAQGNAMMFRKDAPLFPVWDLSDLSEKSPGRRRTEFLREFSPDPGMDTSKDLIEHVHLDSGLYFGDRNTEPRAALVAHLIVDPLQEKIGSSSQTDEKDRRPLDVFIVNLHLVTIMKERVGIPSFDSEAARMRRVQLDTVFDGIVSRYNSWAEDKYPQRGKQRDPEPGETFKRHKAVWILCGDFNFTEDSDEYDFIKRRNFIDTTPAKGRRSQYGKGTKSSGARNPPTLTLDYIFAGPKFIAFHPLFEEAGINDNKVEHKIKVSDHYPVISALPLLLPSHE